MGRQKDRDAPRQFPGQRIAIGHGQQPGLFGGLVQKADLCQTGGGFGMMRRQFQHAQVLRLDPRRLIVGLVAVGQAGRHQQRILNRQTKLCRSGRVIGFDQRFGALGIVPGRPVQVDRHEHIRLGLPGNRRAVAQTQVHVGGAGGLGRMSRCLQQRHQTQADIQRQGLFQRAIRPDRVVPG